jgi:hypothetical protein
VSSVLFVLKDATICAQIVVLQRFLHLWHPQSLSNCFQNPLQQNSEEVPNLKSLYLSHRDCDLQTSHG